MRNKSGRVIYNRRFNIASMMAQVRLPAAGRRGGTAVGPLRALHSRLARNRTITTPPTHSSLSTLPNCPAALLLQYYPSSAVDFEGRIAWNPEDPNVLQV
jgi:hypothetical protein